MSRTEKQEEASRDETCDLPTKTAASIPSSEFRPPQSRASALITTLLVLVVLSTIVVAFMQSMSIERSVARSGKNQLQLQLAIDAGKAAAISVITSMTASDNFIVVRNGDYTYIGSTTNADFNSIAYIPAFSSSTNAAQLLSTTNFTTNVMPSIAAAGVFPTNQARIRPFNDQSRTVLLSLVEVLNATSNSTAPRYAYWIEDLGGKIDGAVAGNLANSLKHSRPSGTNINELALYTLFSSNAAVDVGDSNSRAIIDNRQFLLSPKTYLQTVSGVSSDIRDEIVFNLPTASRLETIPFGYGYRESGKAKYNLNHFVATSNVDGLADAISTNLPTFQNSRRGALTDDYNYTLSANIIDYADTNSTPTIGSNYRGVDSTPFVTIFHDKITLTSVSGATANVEGWVYVQLWNPSDKSISGSFNVEYSNNDDLLVGVNTSLFSASITSGYPFAPQTVTLAPNEITVLGFGPIAYQFNGGGFGSPIPPFSRNAPGHTRTRFQTTWNGNVVDRNNGGIERPNGSLPLNTARWTGGLPGLRHNLGINYLASVANPPSGDPRQLYYLTSPVMAQNYAGRTAWWGMAIMRPMPGRFVTDPTRWLDAAPSSARPFPATNSASLISTSATLATIIGYKSQAGVVLSTTNEAPFIFNNSGVFSNVTELGNVFDPALWSAAPLTTNGIPASASASTNAGGGYLGGASLRIGRPEHPKFAALGSSASQLLDIFSIDGDTTSARVKPTPANQPLNVNSAGTNALRSLIAGIRLERDLAAGTVIPPTNSQAVGQWFANAVISRRQNGPFLSVKDLSLMTNSNGNVFGNPAQWTTGAPASTFKDVGLEELFAKVFNLASVNSRVFRIVVVGQVVNDKGKVLGTATREFHIAFQPQRDGNGTIINQIPQTFYEIAF